VYFFGNENVAEDNAVFEVVNKLKAELNNINFIFINPNEDLPFVDEKYVIILDTVQGIKKIEIITEQDLDKLIINRSTTAHDYDLGFQLKYLKKLGKLEKIIIIGLPQRGEIDYDLIQSILRKLVAHDMHGS
jgi:Ni,Fe-hydrogenase maturation factor